MPMIKVIKQLLKKITDETCNKDNESNKHWTEEADVSHNLVKFKPQTEAAD